MKSQLIIRSAVVGLALCCVMALAGGCDDADSGSVITVVSYRGDNEAVTGPAYLTGAGTIQFAAQYRPNSLGTATNETDELQLPLEWWVNNPELGRIAASGGHEAVYAGYDRVGQNIIFVKDQRGREGVTSVNQTAPSSE